ncbi:hypothetical protein AAHA92_10784 [Salvia divinorum]|uniref:Uncharacterized protein n=1 Tax=Salvia divinorum TaxID=28513 RepID=A0ABD1HZV3_SALDI
MWVKFIELVSRDSLGGCRKKWRFVGSYLLGDKKGMQYLDRTQKKIRELDSLSYRVLEILFIAVDARMIPVQLLTSLRPRTLW